jgi:hypothetical protein
MKTSANTLRPHREFKPFKNIVEIIPDGRIRISYETQKSITAYIIVCECGHRMRRNANSVAGYARSKTAVVACPDCKKKEAARRRAEAGVIEPVKPGLSQADALRLMG